MYHLMSTFPLVVSVLATTLPGLAFFSSRRTVTTFVETNSSAGQAKESHVHQSHRHCHWRWRSGGPLAGTRQRSCRSKDGQTPRMRQRGRRLQLVTNDQRSASALCNIASLALPADSFVLPVSGTCSTASRHQEFMEAAGKK